MNVGSVSKTQAFSKKSTIISHRLWYYGNEFMNLSKSDVLWTVDCICTPRSQCQGLSWSASDQRGVLWKTRVLFVCVSPAELQTAVLWHLWLWACGSLSSHASSWICSPEETSNCAAKHETGAFRPGVCRAARMLTSERRTPAEPDPCCCFLPGEEVDLSNFLPGENGSQTDSCCV